METQIIRFTSISNECICLDDMKTIVKIDMLPLKHHDKLCYSVLSFDLRKRYNTLEHIQDTKKLLVKSITLFIICHFFA